MQLHVPPPTVPRQIPEHAAQAAPLDPHALPLVPATHRSFAQQPPLHG
jgi:hypothetical protein